MDVVALAQFGFRNCVATLGTATNSDQAELLFRAADEVIFCFDGDRAGRKAAWRALEATLPRIRDGRQAKFLFLPEGEDPDTMVRSEGAEAFSVLLDQAQALSAFFFERFTKGLDLSSIDGRAKLVEMARPQLDKIPPGVFHDMMFSRLEALAQHRLDDSRSQPTRPGGKAPIGRKPAQKRTPMRLALAHLVQNPKLSNEAGNAADLSGCDLPGIEIYQELVDFCAKRPNMSTAQLLELWREHPAQAHLRTLATWQLPGEEKKLAQEFRDALTGLELQWTETQISRLPKIVDLGPEERKTLLQLQQRRQELITALQGEKS
jgi:DNA primase